MRKPCNCAQWGNASRCPVHTQADFDHAERVRQGSTWLYQEVGGYEREAMLSVPPGYDAPAHLELPEPTSPSKTDYVKFARIREVLE